KARQERAGRSRCAPARHDDRDRPADGREDDQLVLQMWDLSCPDWEERLREGRPLIPALPLIESQACDGLAFFDALRLPDQPDEPRLGEAAGEWFRALVRAAFGSWNPETGERSIRDIFCLAPKGQSKTTFSAGLIL